MKTFWRATLPLILLCGSLQASHGECMDVAVDEMNELYRTGCGCDDGVFNAVSSSMVGWGVGLFVGICVLTGLIHNAHQGSQTSSSSNNSSQ